MSGELNKYGEIEDTGGGSETQLVKCAHCNGKGICSNIKIVGGEYRSCDSCCNAAGVKRGRIVACGVCGGVGQILLKAK